MMLRIAVLLTVLSAMCISVPRAVAEDKPADPALGATAMKCHLSRLDRGWPRRVCVRAASYDADVCRAIRFYASATGLPPGFFARLVWQESRFDLDALSPAGAEGIAQFMPTTGRLRGLADAYNPAEALARSADYLKFLARKFGNLGLAAAAYNAGEGRMAAVVEGDASAPAETRAYVEIVTGSPIGQWLSDPPPTADYRLSRTKPFQQACVELAKSREAPRFEGPPSAPWKPWGVQLAAAYSPKVARHVFETVEARHGKVLGDEPPMLVRARNPKFGPKPRYHARIGRDTRQAAEALCTRLRAAGGACIVVKN